MVFQVEKMQTFNDLPTVNPVLQSDVLSFVCANIIEGEQNFKLCSLAIAGGHLLGSIIFQSS